MHGLDGAEHRRRKRIFLDLLDRPWVERLAAEVGHELETVTAGWPGSRVRVFEAVVGVYGRSVLRVAGVELSRPAADRVARDLAAVVDGFGFGGAAYACWAVLVRTCLDWQAARLVRDVRHGRVSPRTARRRAGSRSMTGPPCSGRRCRAAQRPAPHRRSRVARDLRGT